MPLYRWCRSPGTVRYVRLGTVMGEIDVNTLGYTEYYGTFPMFLSLRGIMAVANIVSDIEAEIAELGPKPAKARQIKQGTMQKLLTGRIRLV